MRDAVLVIALVVLLATAVTAHVAIVAGLAQRPPAGAPPQRLFSRSSRRCGPYASGCDCEPRIWLASVVLYIIALILSLR